MFSTSSSQFFPKKSPLCSTEWRWRPATPTQRFQKDRTLTAWKEKQKPWDVSSSPMKSYSGLKSLFSLLFVCSWRGAVAQPVSSFAGEGSRNCFSSWIARQHPLLTPGTLWMRSLYGGLQGSFVYMPWAKRLVEKGQGIHAVPLCLWQKHENIQVPLQSWCHSCLDTTVDG